jgi:hypothetical protein
MNTFSDVIGWITANLETLAIILAAIVALLRVLNTGAWAIKALNFILGVIEDHLDPATAAKVKAAVKSEMKGQPAKIKAIVDDSVATVDDGKTTPLMAKRLL